jgi:hypothetical protein
LLLATYKFCEDSTMHAEPATVEVPVLKLPPDLVTEVGRHGASVAKRRNDFRVEGWKPSLFGRIVEKLVGPKDER